MPRKVLIICTLALAGVATLVTAPIASAATTPKITKVAPMRVQVGSVLSISGRNFRSQRKKNTIVFRASNGRTAFAKPIRSSRRKLVLRVPASVARLLTVRNSSQRPTRLKLRVLAGKFSKFTSRRLSPVIVGAAARGDGEGGGGGVVVCDSDSDHDNDLLSNSLEKSVETDPCLDDTDADGVSDGWEYYASKDLNIKAVPYPGKRPFPNALDPSDGRAGGSGSSAYDFDGDGLTSYEEYRLWRRTGSSFNGGAVGGTDLASPLGYSDGTKYSRLSETPAAPAWRSAVYGLAPPSESFPLTYNLHGDAPWRDDERDGDSDGLSNWLEAAGGPGRPGWWESFFSSEGHTAEPWGAKPASTDPPCNTQRFGAFDQRPFADLDLTDSDVDGDALLDGEDDQDNDDFTNIRELYETEYDLDGDGQLTCGTNSYPSRDTGGGPQGINAFNPCAPNQLARSCPDRFPSS